MNSASLQGLSYARLLGLVGLPPFYCNPKEEDAAGNSQAAAQKKQAQPGINFNRVNLLLCPKHFASQPVSTGISQSGYENGLANSKKKRLYGGPFLYFTDRQRNTVIIHQQINGYHKCNGNTA